MNAIKKIWALLRPEQQRAAAVLFGAMLIGMTLEMLGVGLVVPAIALLTEPDYIARVPMLKSLLAAFGDPGPQMLVLGAMLGLTCVYVVKNLFLAFLIWRQTRFAYGVQAEVSQRLFMLYLRQPYTFHLQHNSAQLLRNVTGEVNIFTNSALLPGLLLLSEGLVLFGLCVLLLIVEPLGALIVFGGLGLAAWGFHRLTQGRIARWGQARQHHEGLRIQHLQEGLGGAKEVKLLGREREFLEKYRFHNVQSARAAQLHFTLQQLPRLWLELLAVGGLAILVLALIAQGRGLERVLPTLGLFAAVAFRLLPSVNRLLGAVQALRYGLPVVEVLYAESKLTVPAAARSDAAVPFRETVALDNVSFTYSGGHAPALNGLSLLIRRGESVGFIGSSGAGKSTLVDILLGLLLPDSGAVRVDGENIQGNVRNWQDQIGYVPQSIFLTDDTLRRNVAFGLPDAQIDEAAVWRALRQAQLDEFVNGLPEGLQTLVGERGVRLSGGQRQRIGIARALYHDPAVLVLDEATSSLDTVTEHGVMQAVSALHGAKTILIVAHRHSTVEHCDRLYRLALGRMVEEGTPQSLLSRRG